VSVTPLPAAERVFGFRDHLSLWFSLGVGLLVIQVGSFLAPAVGFREAVGVVVAGSVLGAGLLGWVAHLGCREGLSSAALMHHTLGAGFARLPIILNIVQLLGWTAFELVVMRDGTAALAKRAFGVEAPWVAFAATALWGGLLCALAFGSMVTLVRRFVGRFGMPLVIASLAWLSVQFLERASASPDGSLWDRPGDGSMPLLAALDLVIAMPVSWLPLVADYARYGVRPASALRGTWLGYAVANTWCYLLGVLVVSTQPGPDLVGALLLAQGGLLALGLILIDELDNAYGDVHSGAVSLHHLLPARDPKRLGLIVAGLAIGAALVLPMHALEPFLLILSSVFVPLFGTIAATLTVLPPDHSGTAPTLRPGPIAVWLSGIAVYHALPRALPMLGGALPALAFTLVGGALVAYSARKRVATGA
jgi:NCS1 family nucleobase:cation symporter-1